MRHRNDDELDDDELDDDEPRVRPLRLILGAVFGLAGILGAVWAWAVLHYADPREPQGAAAAIGRHYVSVIAWVTLVVGAIVGLVGTVTLVTSIFEARAVRRRRPGVTLPTAKIVRNAQHR